MRLLQSSQVRWAFWQCTQARLAFFFFGPSLPRVRGGTWGDEGEDSSCVSSSVVGRVI